MKISFWVIIVTFSILSFSCQSEYHRKVEQELASGVRQDSLFLGISFDMDQKAFFGHCWELNKQGLLKQGPENMTIEYKIEDLNYPAKMYFYPEFYKGRIYEMPVSFQYDGWAPWNKNLSADSLQLDVLTLFKERYGNDFMEVKHPEKGVAYVKVDGNRRISIFTNDDIKVNVLFTDLLLEEEVEKIRAEKAKKRIGQK
ncbi:MAG: hypothetical protein ACLFUB_11030 [Cyclobacteriaceae bacterium]